VKPIYIIAYVDYEGIGRIFWAGEDPNEAVKIAKEIKARCKYHESDDDEILSEVVNGNIELDEWHWLEPDRVCIMKPDPEKELEYTCCCNELGFEIGKKIFY
jgi:hypothetical protein